jgi:hypothetical protein
LDTPPERTGLQQRPKKSEQDGAAAAAVPPSTAAAPALESRKQEQNLLARLASGEDTLLLKKEILEYTEQHGPLERVGLAAAFQAGAAARGAGSAAAAAPVPAAAGPLAATGLMDTTSASYVDACMTYDPNSRSADVIGEYPATAWNLGSAAKECCCCWGWGWGAPVFWACLNAFKHWEQLGLRGYKSRAGYWRSSSVISRLEPLTQQQAPGVP